MKKIITFALICCMALTAVLVFHEPVRADDTDATAVGITVAIVGTLVLIGVLITVSSNDEQARAEAALDQQCNNIKEAWTSRIGSWTFDDALALWGNPGSVTQGEGIFVAVYDQTTKASVGNTVYHSGDFFTEATSDTNTNEIRNGEVYTLIFDKNSKTLKHWNWKKYVSSAVLRDLSDGQADAVKYTGNKKGDSQLRAKTSKGGESARPASYGSAPAPTPETTSTLQQKLKDLKKLRDSGDITKEEYTKLREKLLDSSIK